MSKQFKKISRGIRNSFKRTSLSESKPRTLKAKLMLSVAAIGSFFMPWSIPMAQAAITASDPNMQNTIQTNGNITNVYAQNVSGTTGLNRFTDFSVDQGNIANMHFTDLNKTATLNNLINTVQNPIDISGTVNAIRNNQIGGNLFFLSPGGMVISGSGAVNAGSLTVMTPTEDFFTKAGFNVKETTVKDEKGQEVKSYSLETFNLFTDNDANKLKGFMDKNADSIIKGNVASLPDPTKNELKDVAIALNKSGYITVRGQINAQTAMKLVAGKSIDISKKDENDPTPILRTGVVFKQVVNPGDTFEVDENAPMQIAADDNGNLVLTDASGGLTGDGSITLEAQATGVNYKNEESSDLVKFASLFGNSVDVDKVSDINSIYKVLGVDNDDELKALLKEVLGPEYQYDPNKITYQDVWACYTSRANDTALAEISVGKGAIVKAPGKINITATSTLDVTPPKPLEAGTSLEERIKKDYNLAQQMANTKADVIINGQVTGQAVNATASASSTFTADGGNGLGNLLLYNKKIASIGNLLPESLKTDVAKEKIAGIADLANKLNVALGFVNSEANVKVGQDASVTTVTPAANYSYGAGFTGESISAAGDISLNASSSSITNIGMSLVPTKEKKDAEGKVTEKSAEEKAKDADKTAREEEKAGKNGNSWFNGGLIWEQTSSKANVNVEGKLNSQAGINLNAAANNNNKANLSVTPLVIKDEKKGDEYKSTPAYINLALGLINQDTTGKVTLGRELKEGETNQAVLQAVGAVNISATDTINLDSTVGVKSDDTQAVSSAINIINSTNTATVDNYAQIQGAGVSVSATDILGTPGMKEDGTPDITKDKGIVINTSNSLQGIQEEKKLDKEKAPSEEGKKAEADPKPTDKDAAPGAGKDIEVDATKDKAENLQNILKAEGDKNKDAAGEGVSPAPAAGETSTGWNKYFDLGASVTVANFTNDAIVNLKENSKIISANGDAAINALVKVVDSKLRTENVFVNKNADTRFGVNAAVTVENFNNTANVNIEKNSSVQAKGSVQEQGDEQTTSRAANISIGASADNDYNRWLPMKIKIVNGYESVEKGIGILTNKENWDALIAAAKDEKAREALESIIKEKLLDSVKADSELSKDKNKYVELIADGLGVDLSKLVPASELTLEHYLALFNLVEQIGNLTNGVASTVNGFSDIKDGLKYLKDATNFINVYTSASASEQDSGKALAMINGSVGIQNANNHANVIMNDGAVLLAADSKDATDFGNVNVNAIAKGGNVNFAGKFKVTMPAFDTTSGGEVGIGGTVGVQNGETASKVSVQKSAEIYGKNVSIGTDNKVVNAVGTLGGATNNKVGLTGMVSYIGGKATATTKVDSQANINAKAGKLDVTANNNTILTNLAGNVSESSALAVGASVGLISYQADSIAKIANLDGSTGSSSNAWTLNELNVQALNDGVINNLTVAGITVGGELKEKSGAEVSVKDDDGKKTNIDNLVYDAEGHHKESDPAPAPSPEPAPADPSIKEDADGGNGPEIQHDAEASSKKESSIKIGVAGSVSLNKINNKTTAELSDVNFANNTATEKISVNAEDTSYAGAYSGAMARTKSGALEKEDSKFNATLAGAVGINDLTKNTSALIKNTQITNGELTNKAVNSGAQVAAGVGLTANSGKGFTIAGSASVNLIDSTVNANIVNAKLNALSALNNIAYDKDVQVAGGVSTDYAKTSVGIGASVSVENVKNNITASIKNSTITDAGSVNNLALSKLTQVGSAVSVGIARGDESYASINGAVVVNKVKNDLKSFVDNSTISANSVKVEAADGTLPPGEAEHKEVTKLKELTTPDESKTKAFNLEGEKAIENANDLSVDTESADAFKLDSSGDYKKLSDGTFVELTPEEKTSYSGDKYARKDEVVYKPEAYSIQHSGNTIVGSAVGVDVSSTKNPGAALSASVVYDFVDNDFTANVKNSAITVKGTGAEDKLSVAANSDTLMVSSAAGVATKTGGGKGAASGGSVVLSYLDNDTKAVIENNNKEIIANKVDVLAKTASKNISVGGEVGVSTGGVAAGLTWAQNSLNNTTEAHVSDANISGTNTELNVDAENKAKNYAIAAASNTEVSLKNPVAIVATGAYAANTGVNNTKAIIDNSSIGTDTDKANAIKVHAQDNTVLKGIAGTVTIGVGGTKVDVNAGGSVVNNKIGDNKTKQEVLAQINNSSIKITDAKSTETANLNVKAKNYANILSVAAGGAVGFSKSPVEIGASGSVAVDNIYTLTDASMTDTDINSGSTKAGNININAISDTKVVTTADALSVNVDMGKVAGGTMATVAKVNSDADTTAGIYGKNKKAIQNVKDETVKADSKNKITNVAVGLNGTGGAGLASVGVLANVAINKIANDTKAEVNNAKISADNLGVLAASNEQINNYGGALNVSINVGKAGVAVGATTVVNTILGDTTALVNNSELEVSGAGEGLGEEKKKGLVVNADAAHTLNDISVTAGIGGSALAGVAVNATTGVNNISGATKAQVLNTDINKNKLEADYQNADLSIKANDNTKVSAHVGTLSAAGAGVAGISVGAAVDSNKFNREVTAEFVGGSDKNTIQAKNIDVNAVNASKVLLTQSGASAGVGATVGVGVTGAVSVDHFTSNTSANLKNAKVNSSGNVKVDADSSKDIATYTNAASVTGGYVAVAASAAVDVIKENSTTIASISDTDIDKAKDVTLKANNENILKHEFAQGGLAIGLGGSVGASVGVNNFRNTVKTELLNSNIGSKTISVDSFTDLAKNKITDQFTNVNANGGLGAIGVGVGVNTVDTGALTNIEWTNVYAKSIDVKAEEERKITELSVGASIGAGAINTSVMINNIGTALQDVYTEPENPNAEYRIQGIKDKVAEGFKDVNDNNTALSEQGFTKGVVSKGEEYSFDMGGEGDGVKTNLKGSKLIATGTAENEGLSIKSHAKTETNVKVGEGAAAIGKIGVTVAKANIASQTGVNISGGTYQGQNVNIESLTDGEIKQMAVSGNIGGGFINVAVDTVTKTGDNVITIDNANIKATKNYKDANNVQGQLNIQALDQSKIENSSTNVTAGVAVIGAMFAKSYDHSNVGVEIKNNTNIENVNYNVVEQKYKLTADISEIKVYDEFGNETTYKIFNEKEVVPVDSNNSNDSTKKLKFYYLDKAGKKVYLPDNTLDINEYKPVYGDVNILATNSNEVQSDIKLITASLGVSGQGSVALAEVGQRDASGKVVGGQAKINISGTGNKFVGDNVSLLSDNQAKAKANLEASGGTLGLSIGVSTAEAKLQGGTAVEIASGQTFVANDVNFASTGASLKNENDNNAEASITGGSGSAVIITVNNANAIANTESILNVGSEKYQTGIWQEASSESHEKQNIAQAKEQATDENTENKEIPTETILTAGRASVKDGGSNVNMLLGSVVSTRAEAKGLAVGVVASGTNKAYTTNTSKTILNFNPGTFEAESLRIAMGNGDKSNTLANGNGGGIVGISPVAARAEHNNDSEVTLNIGNDQTQTKFNLEKDFYLGVANVVEEEINSNAIQAAIAGGSGVEAASSNISNANLNLTNTTINAKGEVALDAENYHDFNKATDYVIKGNGYGIGYVDIAKFNNVITQNANVNLKNTTIVSQGKVDIAAHNDNNIKSNIYVLSAGGVAGAFATNTIDFNSSSLVDIDNASAIRADGLNSDITLAASDQNKITTMTMAESIGAIGTPTTAKNNNNITRNNKVTVDGTVYGRHDVRLFAGRNEHDEDSSLTLSTYAEAFNKTAIPLGSLPSINNNLNQNNQVYIKNNGQINAVKDVNIYADAGKETYDIFSNAYTSWGSKGNSKVVVSTNGKVNEGQSVDIYGRKTDNHVQVDGAVTAGIANYQKIIIGDNGLIILTEEQYKAVKAYYDKVGKTVDPSIKVIGEKTEGYHISKADLIKVYGNEEGTIDAQAAGLNVDDFKLGTRNYGSELMKRREELGKLLTHYADSKEYAAYVGYKAEYDQITEKLKALGIIDKDGNIIGEILVNYVEVPDIISYGGNVNVSTNNFFSSNATGSVTAKGNPTVKIENKTSLATNINNITVDGKGGAIYYNTLDMAVNSTPETITETIKENIRNQNLDKSKTVANPSSAIGTRDGIIDIAANYSNTTGLQTELHYINTDITDPEDPSYKKEQKMPLKPDVIINGSVAADNGSVSIVNRNGDITIESKTAGGKGAEVVGKTVTIKAEGGSVTQAYQDTIVNIGGDPEQKYLFDYDKDGLQKISIVQVDAGARIAGENVYINAADINVNGTIQSGYDKYSVEIAPDTKLDSNLKVTTGEGRTVTQRIQQIIDNNKGAAVTDNDVVGNYNYLVIAGDTVKNDKGIYEKRIDVYYNPTTNKLVLPSVNSNGGRVYLTGRIASTGDGKINCMDGTYDIAVKNTVDKDLQLGQMVVNDTQGVISITDSRRIIKYTDIVDGESKEKFGALVTEYTRGEDGTVNVKFTVNGKEHKFTEEELKTLGINNNTYTPEKGITYNWTKGQNVGQKKVYTQTWYNKWWGASKSPSEFTTETQAQEPKLTPVVIPGETIEKAQGAFIGDLKETTKDSTKTETKDEFTVYWKRENTKDLVYLNKDIKDNPYHWSSGYLNCHKNTRVVWTHEVSDTDTYVASVKADNPIAINFIGNGTGASTVDVSSTKNITLTGDIGNRQLYETNGALEEKGSVNIASTGGLIEQTGGSIYGRNVTLSADGKFSNINLALGDTMYLTIKQAAEPKHVDRDISVTANSNGTSQGNLFLNDIGSSKTNVISIVNKGNHGDIQVAADKAISANRIDLTTTNGSVTAFVEASQTPYSNDTLSASINVTAGKDITLTQKTGDMRVGTIRSTNGNVTLNVPDGSVVDALPYSKNSDASENDLVDKWFQAGLINDADGTASQAQRDASTDLQGEKQNQIDASNKLLTDYKAFKADESNLRAKYAEYTAAVKNYNEVFGARSKYKSEAEYKTACEEAENKVKGLQPNEKYGVFIDKPEGMTDEKWQEHLSDLDEFVKWAEKEGTQLAQSYEVWDKNALLYSIQDAIVNPTTVPKPEDKAPNVRGNNITLNVKDSAGLLSDKVTTYKVEELDVQGAGLENLKAIARADASSVTWNETDKTIKIQEKLPIGVLLNSESGKLKIANNNNTPVAGSVYVQNRLDPKSEESNPYKDINVAEVKATGDVSIHSIGAIFNAVDPAAVSDAIAIMAKNLELAAMGDIGTADKNLTTDINGGTLAAVSETGNIYIDNIGTSDIYLKNMAAPKGAISVKNDQNIYATDNYASEIPPYVQAGDTITLISRKASVGALTKDGEDEDGMPYVGGQRTGNKGKAIRVLNNGKKVTVQAAENVYVEGISTNTASGTKDPEGTLLLEASNVDPNSKLKNVGVYVNGTLQLAGNLNAQETISLDTPLALNVDSGLTAKNIKLRSGENIELNDNALVQGENINLTAKKNITEVYDLEKGTGSKLITNYTTIDGEGKEVYNQGKLTINNGGTIDLGSKNNMLGVVNINNTSAQADNVIKLGSTGNADIELTIKNSADSDQKIAGSIDVHNYESAKEEQYNDVYVNEIYAKGDLKITNDEDTDDADVDRYGIFIGKIPQYDSGTKEYPGVIDVGGRVDLIAKGIVNNEQAVINQDGSVVDGGLIIAGKDINIQARNFANGDDAKIFTGASLTATLTGEDIEISEKNRDYDVAFNEGTIIAGKDINITTTNEKGSIANFGTLHAGNKEEGSINLDSKNNLYLIEIDDAALAGGENAVQASKDINIKVRNYMLQYGALLAGEDIKIDVGGDAIITGDFDPVSNTGNYLVAQNNVLINVGGDLLNQNAIVAANGEASIKAQGSVINLQQDDEYTFGDKKNVTLDKVINETLKKQGIKEVLEYADFSDGVVYANKDITLKATKGDVVNASVLESYQGDVKLISAEGSVINKQGADIVALGGNVNLEANGKTDNTVYYIGSSGELFDKDAVPQKLADNVTSCEVVRYYKVGADKWQPITPDTKVPADAEIKTEVTYTYLTDPAVPESKVTDTKEWLDDVAVFQKGSVVNYGDIIAINANAQEEEKDTKGSITLKSEYSDVFNYDDFNKSTNEAGIGTAYLGLDKKSYNVAAGNINLLAPEGEVYNSKKLLVALGDVTIEAAKGMDSFGDTIYAGKNINLTATEGDLVNKSKLISLEGNVTLTSKEGSVVNMLNADIEALGTGEGMGNVNLKAGGNTTEGKDLSVKFVNTNGNVGNLEIEGLETGNILAAHKFYLSDKTKEYVQVDDTTNISELSNAEQASLVTVFGLISDDGQVIYTDKFEAKTSEGKVLDSTSFTYMGQTLTGVQQDIEAYRMGDVINRGDIIARGSKGVQLVSEHSNVSNYDNFSIVDGLVNEKGERIYQENIADKFNAGTKFNDEQYNKGIISVGDIGIHADEGYIYNNMDIITEGNVDITSGKALTSGLNFGRIEAGKNVNISSKENVNLIGKASPEEIINILSKDGIVSIASLNGDVHAENFTIEANSKATEPSPNGSIVLTSTNGNINFVNGNLFANGNPDGKGGTITAAVGVGAEGTPEKPQSIILGEIGSGKELKANQIIVLNENVLSDSEIKLGDITVNNFLVIEGQKLEIGKISREKQDVFDTLNVAVTGAQGGTMESPVNLETSGDTRYHALNVTDANVSTTDGGKLEIDKLHTAGKVQVDTLGFTTSIYGRTPDKDDTSATIYYDLTDGSQAKFDLDGKEKLGFSRESRYGALDVITNSLLTSENIPASEAHKDGAFYLNTFAPDYQESNGLLLHRIPYHYVHDQRYSLEDLTRKLDDTKSLTAFHENHKGEIRLYDRYNLYELADGFEEGLYDYLYMEMDREKKKNKK